MLYEILSSSSDVIKKIMCIENMLTWCTKSSFRRSTDPKIVLLFSTSISSLIEKNL